MKRPVLFIPLGLFFVVVVVFLLGQLLNNAQGDDPTKLESVLVGKPVPEFRLEDLTEAGKLYDQDIFKGQLRCY